MPPPRPIPPSAGWPTQFPQWRNQHDGTSQGNEEGAAPQAPPPGPESQQPGAGPLAAPGVSDWWTIRARR
ncbi:hypothetical protein [Mycolicibacterium insubricum]|uniref:hypothetical protein n=1 Tax=Mycolicibacterium insubricum TaxID=444597 RepID=UPI0021F36882|nr:hypothetical protein [Mycolicibacterium insubricum]MCV7082250.1 hypothetical protein [Mycolicibacterium insubricum]